jgi:hypothetical protein
MSELTKTILFETSPYGTLDGIVEHDERAIYFYLNGRQAADPAQDQDRFGTRACWVRNLQRGPLVISEQEMQSGIPPMLPRNDCVDAAPGKLPEADDLRIVWFEEGNGAALIETDRETGESKTIAVIPTWSGVDGFHGYAAGCAHPSPLCWPMPDNETLRLRIHRAEEFWSQFTESNSPFAALQQQLLEVFGNHFSKRVEEKYYSIDGGKFPPRGLARYESEQETILVTVGMSLCPQPAVELFVDDPSSFRRIELGVKIAHTDGVANESTIEQAMSKLSSFAGYPWSQWTWLGPKHTLAWPLQSGGNAELNRDEQIKLPKFREDPISLLWIG